MKLWKKISLLLCACFAFSSIATSCDLLGHGDDSSSSSSSSSQKPNSSNGDNSSVGDIEIDDEDVIDVYMGMIAMKLEETQSAKLTFELGTTTTASGTDGVGTVGSWTNYTLKGEGLVSKTDDGYNAKLDVQVPSEENAGQTEDKTYYYVDGYVYEYDADTSEYTRSNETLEETLDNLVHATSQGAYTLETLTASLVGGSGLLGEDVELSFEGLQEGFSDYAVIEGELTDSGMKISADATQKAGELFDFLRDVDNETTYGELLDYPLSQIDPDLDTDAIITELYLIRNDTVAEVIEKFDEKAIEETGKTLQENIDALLKNETVLGVLDSLGEEVSTLVKSFKVEDLVEEYGELTMDDLTAEIVNELADVLVEAGVNLEEIGFDTSDATFSMLITVLETVLKMPALADLQEGDVLYEILETVKTIEVSATDMQFELKANEDAIESVTLLGNFNGNATEGSLSATVGATADIRISEFSKNRVTIAIPEDATIVIKYNECATCGEAKESVAYCESLFDYYCADCYFGTMPEATDFTIETYKVENGEFQTGGEDFTLSEQRGKVVIVHFWETWCSPSRIGFPTLVGLQKNYGDDLAIVCISRTSSGVDSALEWLNSNSESTGIKLNESTIIFGSYNSTVNSVYNDLGFSSGAIPAMMIITKDGHIAWQGEGANYYETLEEKLELLI